jgi:outer membrane protein OmpA-like peptidoglycan-associated protein/tetratricopeptide (TPR) repeat protein
LNLETLKRLLVIPLFLALPAFAAPSVFQLWEQADAHFSCRQFEQAAALYEKIFDDKPSYDVARQAAQCYVQLGIYNKALPWTVRAIRYSRHTPEDELLNMQMLLANERYIEARATARRCVSLLPSTLDLIIASADSAIRWMRQPTSCIITWLMMTPIEEEEAAQNDIMTFFKPLNLGGNAPHVEMLNTAGSDWGMVRLAKNEYVYASNSRDSLEFAQLKGQAPTHLYISRGGEEGKLLFAPAPNEQSEAAPCFSANGSEIFYSASRMQKPPIASLLGALQSNIVPIHTGIYYRKQLGNGAWSAPITFPHNNEAMYSMCDPWLTADGQRLFFASDFPHGDGKSKIFYVDRDPVGTFGYPVCLNAPINTDGYISRFPRFDPQGNFYFATNGLPGLGGLDIFKVRIGKNGEWGEPENMRYPFNSPQDDFAPFFVSEKKGYLSSGRTGGRGRDDIYAFDLTPPAFLYHEIVDPNASEATPEEQLGIKDISTLTASDAITLKKIYYDTDSWNIRADVARELQKLVALLRKYPDMVIEVNSHTDNRGTPKYNMSLSQLRAETIAKYLYSYDIEKERVVPKGYGDLRLKVRCGNGLRRCTENDHQSNRRTEFYILKK